MAAQPPPPPPPGAADPTFHQPNPNSTLTSAEHSGSDQSSAAGDGDGDGEDEEACLVCTRVAARRARLPCGHHWCRRCLRTSVRTALRGGEGAWPPRCCPGNDDGGGDGEIGEAVVRWLGDERLAGEYRRRREEMGVEIGRRVYCHIITCGTFIHPDHHRVVRDGQPGGRVAVCQQEGCGRETCVDCGTRAHPGEACPRDPEMEAVLQTIETHGYQFCRRCNTVVERIDGCNHMRCRCGYEFCYMCGNRWRTCGCPQFGGARRQRADRPRLEEAVRAVVDDPLPPPPPLGQQQEQERQRQRQRQPVQLPPLEQQPQQQQPQPLVQLPPPPRHQPPQPQPAAQAGRAHPWARPQTPAAVHGPTWEELGNPYGRMDNTPENEAWRRTEQRIQERIQRRRTARSRELGVRAAEAQIRAEWERARDEGMRAGVEDAGGWADWGDGEDWMPADHVLREREAFRLRPRREHELRERREHELLPRAEHQLLPGAFVPPEMWWLGPHGHDHNPEARHWTGPQPPMGAPPGLVLPPGRSMFRVQQLEPGRTRYEFHFDGRPDVQGAGEHHWAFGGGMPFDDRPWDVPPRQRPRHRMYNDIRRAYHRR